MADARLAQHLMLSLLGVRYKLGAENNPSDYDLTSEVPDFTDCAESLQMIMSNLGHPEFGDGSWLQWAKCNKWNGKNADWPFMGIGVLFNNPAHNNKVGHIFANAGKNRHGKIMIFESRGNAYGGTRLTRIYDMMHERGPAALGIYEPLVLEGEPDYLYAWRGKAPSPTTAKVQTVLRKLGYRGDNLQRVYVDGEFGPITQQAVRAYQREHSQFPDGAVTGDVWESMKGNL